MTTPQWLSIGLLSGMMALFVWDRFRYDVTAILALIAALALGLVEPKKAFTGFSYDIVIIVGSALVLSAAMQRSGLIERALAVSGRRFTRVRSQLLVLTTSVGLGSALIKNVGALAMLMPAAFQMAKKNGASPSVFLMPMSFASLLGGLMTLVGTSPNIIVSRVREEMAGKPFGMFDYLPTGLGLLVLGLIFLRFGYRLLPRNRRASPTLGESLDISRYVTEVGVREGSSTAGETVRDFVTRHEREISVTGMIRAGARMVPSPGLAIEGGDTLIIAGEPDALERVIAGDNLTLVGEERELATAGERDDIGVIEGVIAANSVLIGQTAGRLRLQERYGVNLIAVSREGERLTRELAKTKLCAGDVIVLQGQLSLMPERLRDIGVLPLAERTLRLGSFS